MQTTKEAIATVFIEKLFAHTDGARAISVMVSISMGEKVLLTKQHARKQEIVRQFVDYFDHILFTPWNLCVTCSPNDLLKDTKNCVIHMFGEKDGFGLPCSEILSAECGFLLRRLIQDKTAFVTTMNGQKLFHSFFANNVMENKIDRVAFAEYTIMYFLFLALQNSDICYINSKMILLHVLCYIRDISYHNDPPKYNIMQELISYLTNDVVQDKLELVIISMSGYTLDNVKSSRPIRRDIIKACWSAIKSDHC